MEMGYTVDAVFTGRVALDWADSAPYDMIILDILLPEMDGLTACSELQEQDAGPHANYGECDQVRDQLANFAQPGRIRDDGIGLNRLGDLARLGGLPAGHGERAAA
jgi:hypothetical protein